MTIISNITNKVITTYIFEFAVVIFKSNKNIREVLSKYVEQLML